MPEHNAGLAIVHANRLETLRDLLVRWMRDNPLAPLEQEQILVQSNGIAQWLRMALAEPVSAGGAGIAAGLQLSLPSAFLWQAYRAVLGDAAVPPESPYDKPRLQWRLMRLLPQLLDQPEFASLAQYLDDDPGRRKGFQLAQHLADLYDQYQVYRADWLVDWAQGLDQLRDGDGSVRPLPPEQRWQALLWRAIRDDLEQQRELSRADLHQRFLERCAQLRERPQGLPPRVMVFGISALPQQAIEALAALSGQLQVLIAVLNPCRYYWADIIEGKELLRARQRRQKLRPGMPAQLSDADLHLHAPPLLAAWGKQGRDYIRLLDQFDNSERYRHWFHDSRIDLFDPPADAPGPLLHQLQREILELEPPPATPRELPPADASLLFQIAHSPQREVEILQDQLLQRLQADPTLSPRDLIVMVPDIAVYQPHIDAVFGRLAPDDPRYIPYSVADRAERGRAPLLVALEQLLRVPESRLGVSELIDLLEVPALQRRYGLNEGDIPRLQQWIEGAGIRWGLDAEHRAGLELPPGLEQNAWLFGIRRMLLGYASGGSDPFAGIEPYDEVAGLEAASAGALALLIDDLRRLNVTLAQDHPPQVWREQLAALLETFFSPADDDDLLLLERLGDELQRWSEAADSAGYVAPLPLAVVREVWLGGIDEGSLSARFLAGRLTFSTLMPMRAIPFRQVFLLGMNDGDYPRQQPPQDFDLMGREYRPGDRSRREDDRYLFLEALLSAREALYISWVGRSIRDNQPQPPSVLVAQLRDHIALCWRGQNEQDPLPVLTCEHPLQPFSRDYFDPDPDADPRLFTYADEWRRVHGSAVRAETAAAPLAPLLPEGALSLAQLARFLRAPVASFFAERLKVRFDTPQTVGAEHEPFDFDGLEQFQLGQELIAHARHADEQSAAIAAQLERWRRAGRLPVAAQGRLALEPILSPVRSTLRHLQPLHVWQPFAQGLEVELEFELSAGSVRIEDWLGDVSRLDAAWALIRTSPQAVTTRQGPRWHRLIRLWVELLAGCAQGYDLRAWLVGPDRTIVLDPIAPARARERLSDLLEAWLQGMRAPLPLACKTALTLLSETPEKALSKAQETYIGGFNRAGERDQDAALARAWPDAETLFAAGLEHWAETLYRPLVEHARILGQGESA
jgi:exodeoxyribonuclease V gamma subunit